MFEPTFKSLLNYKCPDWFRDVKFGIWSHWGPQSVPMCGDWYARNMYEQGTEQYEHHVRVYGHPSKFGYKDICKLWKAEKFDPMVLMEKYYKAGARFFVAQACHHDHFFNFASKLNRFNSVQVGPHKDICGLWQQAARKYNMPFGITEHLGASFAWWRTNKSCDAYGPYAGVPYDGNDPEYRDFYHDNYEHDIAKPWEKDKWVWLTTNEKFRRYWLDVMKEIIDNYHPDLLYSDSNLPFGETDNPDNEAEYRYGLEAVAYLYNDSEKRNGKNLAVYTQKSKDKRIYPVGVLDIERSQLPVPSPEPWQSETCIGGWFYDTKAHYKTPRHIIDILVDTISKNGTFLLNILQKPDGSIDEQADWILSELAKWFAINGDAVYETRPWRIAAEGHSSVLIDGFREEQVDWQDDDFRFVQKQEKLYVYVMKSANRANTVIKSLKPDEKVLAAKLLGHGKVTFAQHSGILVVDLPEKMPSEYACVLELSF